MENKTLKSIGRSSDEMIPVEISPSCNLSCEKCIVKKRLHGEKPRDNPKIVEEIIQYVPQNSYLGFIGLGEPLMPIGQKRIEEIMTKRKDIQAHIQTNGSFKLNNKLVEFVKEGRLDIGISYDPHHQQTKNYKINIQKDCVIGITVVLSSTPKNFSVKSLKRKFPNLAKILVGPMFDINISITQPIMSWEKVYEFCAEIGDNKEGIIIFLEISKDWEDEPSKEIIRKARTGKRILKECYAMPEGFFIYIDEYSKVPRILTNSKVLLAGEKGVLSWKEIENELVSIEKFFKD